MISQVFRLLEILTSGKIKGLKWGWNWHAYTKHFAYFPNLTNIHVTSSRDRMNLSLTNPYVLWLLRHQLGPVYEASPMLINVGAPRSTFVVADTGNRDEFNGCGGSSDKGGSGATEDNRRSLQEDG